jgi:AcrR family transcriptional regulator
MVPQLSTPLATGVAAPEVPLAGKERILREGQDQFVSRGYADVTMQDVADAVGLTKAAVYYHFGDKEGLFEAVFFAEMERVAAGIATELAVASGFRTELEGVARFLLLTGGSSLGRLIADLDRYVGEERRRELLNRVPHPYAVIRPAFVRAVASGAIRPVDLDVVIPLYFAMIFGQIRSEAHGRPAAAPPAALAKSIADVTIDGIGTRDERVGENS